MKDGTVRRHIQVRSGGSVALPHGSGNVVAVAKEIGMSVQTLGTGETRDPAAVINREPYSFSKNSSKARRGQMKVELMGRGVLQEAHIDYNFRVN